MLPSVCSCLTPAEEISNDPLNAFTNINKILNFLFNIKTYICSSETQHRSYQCLAIPYVQTGGPVTSHFSILIKLIHFRPETANEQPQQYHIIIFFPFLAFVGERIQERQVRIQVMKFYRKDHTRRRFIKILKLSRELTYCVITAEFERSSNISPRTCKRGIKRITQQIYMTLNKN